MPEKLFDVGHLGHLAFKLSCEEQFQLATAIAANVGYVLGPEPSYSELTIDQRVSKLERIVSHLCPDKSGDI